MNLEENIRILLVDNDASVRKRLRVLLGSVPKFEIVGEAENGKLAMELTRKLLPDIVIMDIDTPAMNGIEATRWIALVSPDIKVIAYTSLDDEIRMMVESGATEPIYRFCGDKEIVSTIKSLFESQTRS